MRLPIINTERLSAGYRAKAIDVPNRRLLITNFRGSKQEQDLTEPANCGGLGRIRHFRRGSGGQNWPANPLPIDPASRALGLAPGAMVRAQVFQNAVCNWRCWYCFVDFALLSADPRYSEWVTADELVERYLSQGEPPAMIDLTGGQPDLTPEWVPWTMDALEKRGLTGKVYLWSDDNLSNDYFWRFLTDKDRERIATFPGYGRVCCFKGYSAESFSFNTQADPMLFDEQFRLMKRLVGLGLDVYAYVTFTTPTVSGLEDDMRRFVDRLQGIDGNLPLRTVPLRVEVFTPVKARLDEEKRQAMRLQQRVVDRWGEELQSRYSMDALSRSVVDTPLRARRGAIV